MAVALDDAVEGVVVGFDDDRGIGTVRSDDGVEHFFHCTAIVDGTRSIDVGERVSFRVVPGHLGHWEATSVKPRP